MFFGSKKDKVVSWAKKGNIEKLTKAIEDKDPEVRSATAMALAELKGDDSFNMLVASLRDPSPSVRKNSAYSLGKLGEARAFEHLRHQLADEDNQDVKDTIEKTLKELSVTARRS